MNSYIHDFIRGTELLPEIDETDQQQKPSQDAS
jgi:hypothetical protein